MEHFTLPASTYSTRLSNTQDMSSPQARRTTINTVIEDSPQIDQGYFFNQYPPVPQRPAMFSTIQPSPSYSEDLPTPTGPAQTQSAQSEWPLSPTPRHSISPKWRKNRDDPDFDSLYDLTDDDIAEEVPLKCSNSVKKVAGGSSSNSSRARSSRSRYPSLVIPSPANWPTIEKLQSAVSPASYVLPASGPARDVLNMLASRKLHSPGTNSAPSLDGSLSSEELEHLSCPSTPDNSSENDKEIDYLGPVQLNHEAMETLHHLSGDQGNVNVDQVIEVFEGEMEQVVGGPRRSGSVERLYAPQAPLSPRSDALSALSIPSPGGFFSSLQGSARHTWSIPPRPHGEPGPSTSVAENFYGVPWRDAPNDIVEQVVEVPADFGNTGEPTPSGIDGLTSPLGEILEIRPSETVYEYNEHYASELAQLGRKNLSRTSLWLSAQETWLQGVLSPSSPTDVKSALDEITSPSKKSVRFADIVFPEITATTIRIPTKDTTFLEAVEYLREFNGRVDAFIHRLARTEAIHLRRRCMPKVFRKQLLGRFEVNTPSHVPSSRPVSQFYADDPSEHKEQITKAQREQQVLELMRPNFWVLEATRLLHGGRLFVSPAWKVLQHTRDKLTTRVLDLGGQAVGDWGWHVALDFPRSRVITATTSTAPDASTTVKTEDEEREVAGPSNHSRMLVPNLWTLPFPSGHFDVVSARSLQTILRTSIPTTANPERCDEYDLCLRECMRVLKPGGYLEFRVQDADLLHAPSGSRAQALSVEFGFNLLTRGYDAMPSKTFLSRLEDAGFGEVRRMWSACPFPRTAGKWTEKLNVGADPSMEVSSPLDMPATTPSTRPRAGTTGSRSSSSDTVVPERTIAGNGDVLPAATPKQDAAVAESLPAVVPATSSRPSAKHFRSMSGTSILKVLVGGGSHSSSINEVVRSPPSQPLPTPPQPLPQQPAEPVAAEENADDDGEPSGSTTDARDVAGLVGAWAWEKWLARLQAQMAKEQEQQGQGLGTTFAAEDAVARAIEEGAKDGAAWRVLEGWARKAW
ncbi:uncharacterized protein J3D65DRAFT_613678 [Phyllosticta citribraziliensis]|uniref:Methyltransferase type 11 domain-containing protein n=1 Tax=Phyllosticta citribraziliensis TaxID=989973 RepID=A0ABR1M474_9PEZI